MLGWFPGYVGMLEPPERIPSLEAWCTDISGTSSGAGTGLEGSFSVSFSVAPSSEGQLAGCSSFLSLSFRALSAFCLQRRKCSRVDLTPRKCAFLLCGHLDFESAVIARNDLCKAVSIAHRFTSNLGQDTQHLASILTYKLGTFI